MSEITYRATYSGHVDGKKVAWTYRAYNEEGAPYVLVLGAENDVSTIVQAPTEFLDGEPDEEADREHAIHWVHRLTELVQKAEAYDEIFDAITDAVNEDVPSPQMCGLPSDSRISPEFADWLLTLGPHWQDLAAVGPDEDDDDLAVTTQLWLPIDESERQAMAEYASQPIEEYQQHEAFVVDELTDVEADTKWVDCDGDHYRHIDGRWYLSDAGTGPWYTAVDSNLTDYGPYTAVDA